MRIKFFGTGSAFTLKNYQTNIGIENNGKWLLLDAGGDIRFSLKEQNLTYKDIDAIYISHLHADHAGGIEWAGFSSYFDPSKEKIKLFGNGELLSKGWDTVWRGGLESVQGKLLTLNDFFEVHSIKPNGSFTWEEIYFTTVQVIHIMNGYSIVPSYGLIIKPKSTSTKTIFWGADMQFCPHQIMDFYKEASMIIQDCETSPYKSGVHAHFDELNTLPEEIKKKMVLVHYQDNVLDEHNYISDDWDLRVEEAGFNAIAERGFGLNINVDDQGKFLYNSEFPAGTI